MTDKSIDRNVGEYARRLVKIYGRKVYISNHCYAMPDNRDDRIDGTRPFCDFRVYGKERCAILSTLFICENHFAELFPELSTQTQKEKYGCGTPRHSVSIQIHKSADKKSPVKLYANVPSRSRTGLNHVVTYIRKPGMERWTCTCEDQIFNKTVKSRHCDHIKLVRSQEAALKTLSFKVGDKVRILRKAKNLERGWANTWVEDMNKAVGKIGTIYALTPDCPLNIDVDVAGCIFGYPTFVLEKVPQAVSQCKAAGKL